jgi:hypothetical protein
VRARSIILGVLVVTNNLWASAPETFNSFPRTARGGDTIRLTLLTAGPRDVTGDERRQVEIRVLQSWAVQLRAQLAVLPEREPSRAIVLRRLNAVMRRVNELSAGLAPRDGRAAP